MIDPWYASIAFVVGVGSICCPQSNRYLVFSATLLILFAGLRSDVGYDYSSYVLLIKSTEAPPSNPYQFESISHWLMWVSNALKCATLYFFTTSLLIVGLFATALHRASPLPVVSCLAFLCLPFMYLEGLTIIRQMSAVSLVFFSLGYWRYDPIKRSLGFLAAPFLHYSAVYFLPLLPFLSLAEKKYSTGVIITFFLMFTASGLSVAREFIAELPFGYYTTRGSVSGQKIAIFYVMLLSFFLVARSLLKREYDYYLNLFTVGVGILVIGMSINQVAGRISIYLLTACLPLISACVVQIRPKAVTRILTCILLVSLFTLLLHYGSKSPTKDPYHPYKTIWH